MSLVLFSAILLILSFPNYNLSFLAWFSFVPILISLHHDTTKKESFFWGLLFGLVVNIGLLYWVVPTFVTAGESWFVGVLCLLILSTYLALYYGLFFWLSSFTGILSPWGRGNGERVFLFLLPGFVWVALEYLRTHLFSGFPWVLLGYTQWNFLPIIQISEFTGVYGVSFLVITVNFMVAEWLSALERAAPLSLEERLGVRGKINVITVAVMFLVCLTFGFWKLSQPAAINKPSFRTVILQGNIDQYKKWDKQYEQEIIDAYTGLLRSSVNEEPDLVVWPETAVPGYLCYNKQLWDWVKELVKQTNCYHLVGSVNYKNNKNYNSSFLIGPEWIVGEYSKIHLVPFGEYVPLQEVLSKYIKTLTELGGVSPGKEFTVFNTPYAKLSSNICFEAVFPDLIRRFVKNGAEVIVNQTNDGWYLNTSAPYQHFVVNVFRAVENRRYVVRAANTGISAIIEPSGKIQTKTELFKYCYLAGQVSPLNETTFYTLFGNIFAQICSMIVIILMLWKYVFRTCYGNYKKQ